MWVSQVSDRRKNHFKAVTGMGSGSPEWQGGYPILKATPKRGLGRGESQPELRLAIKETGIESLKNLAQSKSPPGMLSNNKAVKQ